MGLNSAVVTPVVAIVDPFSTGEVVAEQVKKHGYGVVLVYSQEKQDGSSVFCNKIDFMNAEVTFEGDVASTSEQLKALGVSHVIVGAESGVLLADQLMEAMQLNIRNPLKFSLARRSKYLQHEVVRAAGVRAAKQILATSWEQVEAFMTEWNPTPFKVIVKPNQSAGSDDVFLCTNMEETKAAFNCINGAINMVGEQNDGVLVMEFLQGEEYVIDSVSREGERKVVGIWKYDKRCANGQFNVYHGMEMVPVESAFERELVEYSCSILDALEIFNGPAHMEVIITPSGPCLVEVGARCHGGHGTWKAIADAAFGYNQINATIDAFMHPERFNKLPAFPSAPMSHGKEVFLVSYREGTLRSIPGAERVKALPSFRTIDLSIESGQELHKTVDLFTMPGRVQLLHPDKEQVDGDYLKIHTMLKDGDMFELVSGKERMALPEGPAEESPAM